jgi:nitroreductase
MGIYCRASPKARVLIGLSSIYWRESWKYGERAYRYCNHDVGHTLGAFTIAGACLGWKVQLIDTLTDSEIGIMLGIDQQTGIEAEHVDCLMVIFPHKQDGEPVKTSLTIDPVVVQTLQGNTLLGEINRLSEHHHDWPIIEQVILATERHNTNVDQEKNL